MVFRVAEFVEQRTDTTGTSDLELIEVTGRNTFVLGIGDGNTTDYAVFNSTQWEVGTGTVVAGSPDVLQRTTVRASSNGGNKVSFSSGTKTVVCSQAAHRIGGNDPHDLVQLDDNGDVSISGGVRIQSTLSVKQDMSVSGSLTLARTLHVGKDASVSGSLAVGAGMSVGGALTVSGDLSLGGAVTSDISAVGQNVIAAGIVANTASFSQAVTIDGDLSVSGVAVISGLTYPTTDGNAGEALVTDGNGSLSFSTVAADWSGISSTYSASTKDRLLVDTGGSTLTVFLPSGPSLGDNVWFADKARNWETNNLTVDGNGNNVLDSSTFTADVDDWSFSLVYTGQQWVFGHRP